jgi:FixJ family two-component response regulator
MDPQEIQRFLNNIPVALAAMETGEEQEDNVIADITERLDGLYDNHREVFLQVLRGHPNVQIQRTVCGFLNLPRTEAGE